MIKTGYLPARAKTGGGVPYREQSGAGWPGATGSTPRNASQHWNRVVTERASVTAPGCRFCAVIASERSGFQLISTKSGSSNPRKPTAYWLDRNPVIEHKQSNPASAKSVNPEKFGNITLTT